MSHTEGSIAEQCIGALAAQEVVTGLREGSLTTHHAWLRLVELAVQYGWRSSACCCAFVLELAKRASR